MSQHLKSKFTGTHKDDDYNFKIYAPILMSGFLSHMTLSSFYVQSITIVSIWAMDSPSEVAASQVAKNSSYCVIVRVRVVLKRTVVADWRFDNMSGSASESWTITQCELLILLGSNHLLVKNNCSLIIVIQAVLHKRCKNQQNSPSLAKKRSWCKHKHKCKGKQKDPFFSFSVLDVKYPWASISFVSQTREVKERELGNEV